MGAVRSTENVTDAVLLFPAVSFAYTVTVWLPPANGVRVAFAQVGEVTVAVESSLYEHVETATLSVAV